MTIKLIQSHATSVVRVDTLLLLVEAALQRPSIIAHLYVDVDQSRHDQMQRIAAAAISAL